MIDFNAWCDWADTPVASHTLRIMTSRAVHQVLAVTASAAIIPDHYAAEERLARALLRLGKPQAAKMLTDLLPTSVQIRSGDLGEIYATEWINRDSGYQAPINRLRWKDHRNMAMRGDDVIGLKLDLKTQRLCFLKTEAKSRAKLVAKTLTEAREGLDKDGGFPSAHALSFISSRLTEMGSLDLADAIDDAQLVHGIPAASVQHLTFVFSGTPPLGLMTRSLQGYGGNFNQWGVGVHIDGHAAFVRAVYEQVIANANQP